MKQTGTFVHSIMRKASVLARKCNIFDCWTAELVTDLCLLIKLHTKLQMICENLSVLLSLQLIYYYDVTSYFYLFCYFLYV